MASRLSSSLPFTNVLVTACLLWALGTTWGQHAQEPIQLADNTEKGVVVSESVLSLTQQQRHYGSGSSGVLVGHRTYSLLQSPASRYFILDSRKGQLRTASPVDRDLLCPEAGLCCQTSLLPDYRSCVGSRAATGYLSGTAAAAGPMGDPNGKVTLAQTQVCSFNLSVSVVSAEGQQPTVYDIPVYVCEENDHAPEFKVPLSSTGKSANGWNRYDGSSQQSRTSPVHVVEVSESVSVGHRIRLPTAEDIDAPPFNVQRYELADASNNFDASLLSSRAYFKLEIVQETGPVDSGQPLHNNQLAYSQGSTITGLELVVLQTLDREKTPSHQLTVLAVDGGRPALTGTLRVQLIVLDANDHVPVFSRPVYEAIVDEGEAGVFNARPILQVNATDQDEGDNARILYDWSELAGPGPLMTATDETGLTREAMAVAPPSFWFRLDNRTGAIYLRRPLDYEMKRQHRFQLLAYNPPVTGNRRVPDRAGLALASATTNVIIQVRNLDDEPPLIVIDYVNGDQRHFKEIKENLPSPYFIAFITVNDPDLTGSPAVMLQTNHQADTGGSPSVNCQLDSHQESYKLERQMQASLAAPSMAYADLRWPGGGGSKVRFTLSTRRPLDREEKDENDILIRCWDSGLPPKTATAVVRHKKYVDYCRSIQSPGDASQSSHNRCSVRMLCDVPPGYHTSPVHATIRQAYNIGLSQSGHVGSQQPFPQIHHIPRSSDAFYFNAGNRLLVPTNGGFFSPVFGQTQQQQHGFAVDPSHEMSFRPIRDESYMYQRIDPCEMYSTGKLQPNAFGEEQISRRQTMTAQQSHHNQHHNKISLLSPSGEATIMMAGHPNQHHRHHHERQPSSGDLATVLWRSDPSLCNQPIPARFPPCANQSEVGSTAAAVFSSQARQALGSASPPPPLLLDECLSHNNHQHHHQIQEPNERQRKQRKIKRSKSMQRHRPQPPSADTTNNNNNTYSSSNVVTAAYYSLLHPTPVLAVDPRQGHKHQQHHHWQQEQEEDLDTLPLVNLSEDGASGRESETTGSPNRGLGGAGISADAAANDEDQSVAVTTENYAVSYPKVQASFV